jgi:hypothetical protein
MLLSVTKRSARGISVSGNYTLSECFGHPNAGGGTPNLNSGYTNPADIDYDYGHCDSDRRHNFNMTFGAQSPQFDNRLLRAFASDWRVSAIFQARSGSPMTVSVNTDPARTGVGGQRATRQDDVDPYGAKTVANYLNPAAFAQPAIGTYGAQERNSLYGPGYKNIDVALVRAFRINTHRIEARVESFNALNWFRMNNPQTSLNSNQFGRVTSAGDPRIMQFALKYSF